MDETQGAATLKRDGHGMDDTRLGTILLEHRIIQEADLERCLDIQALSGGSMPLGRILIEQGIITEDILQSFLRFQEGRRRGAKAADVQLDDPRPGEYLAAACRAGANELVVSEGRPLLIRVAGQLRQLTHKPVASPDVWEFVRDQMGPEVLDQLADQKTVSRDFHRAGVGRGRITAFRHFDGVAVVVRMHPETIRTPEEVGLDPAVLEILRGGKGLVLLSGQIRSGLTETMATILGEIAKVPSRYVLVLDDHLECPAPKGGSVVVRRRIGEHVRDYVLALKAAMREAPDAIVVGDVSDPEAFDLALRAAEKGHLVVAGMHAPSVVGALHRVLNYYPNYDVQRVRATLASVLRCVLTLHLVPDTQNVNHVPASELLLLDDAARDVVRNGKLASLGLVMGLKDTTSGHSLDQSLLKLLRDGQARFDDIFICAQDKARILQYAENART